ncbi:hypothetical protein HDU76_003253 [Blyttiomyces sp. JEL0837]|nr:hypothetical protein HDU76_003253 [Blyttiomyces sp. JEL0837]
MTLAPAPRTSQVMMTLAGSPSMMIQACNNLSHNMNLEPKPLLPSLEPATSLASSESERVQLAPIQDQISIPTPAGTPPAETAASVDIEITASVISDGSSSAAQSTDTSAVYQAVYSGVTVYEILCDQVLLMRRNPTRGFPKNWRSKILEDERGADRVQGGFSKFQGTWVSFTRGVEIAKFYGVYERMRSLIDFEIPPPNEVDNTPTRPKQGQHTPNNTDTKRKLAQSREKKVITSDQGCSTHGNATLYSDSEPPRGSPTKKKVKLGDINTVGHSPSTQADDKRGIVNIDHTSGDQEERSDPDDKLLTPKKFEFIVRCDDRTIATARSLHKYTMPTGFDINMTLDEFESTAVHYAAALSKIELLSTLVTLGASVTKTNSNNESALIYAVMFGKRSEYFVKLLPLLADTISITDDNNRTVVHHIVLKAVTKRADSSVYYLRCLFDFCNGGQFNVKSFIDIQDTDGNTALNIAARMGSRMRVVIEILLQAGANPHIPNFQNLTPVNFMEFND